MVDNHVMNTHQNTIVVFGTINILSSENYFTQAVLRKSGFCFWLVKYCHQASLGENKIWTLFQVDGLTLTMKICQKNFLI